jgi:hypothetical protein
VVCGGAVAMYVQIHTVIEPISSASSPHPLVYKLHSASKWFKDLDVSRAQHSSMLQQRSKSRKEI